LSAPRLEIEQVTKRYGRAIVAGYALTRKTGK